MEQPATVITVPLQIYVPDTMLTEIKNAASRVGATASAYARQAIMEKINHDNNLYQQKAA